jgi:CubicO group peptidase (beta-lactamase class C family)
MERKYGNAPKTLHVSPEDQLDTHSISKLMAAALIVKLENEHLLIRTDSVARYSPISPTGSRSPSETTEK